MHRGQAFGGNETKPAPGELGVLQAFLNTVDLDHGEDRLGSPEGLRAWLLEKEMIDEETEISSNGHATMIRFREGMRDLLDENSEASGDPESLLEELNEIADLSRARLRFNGRGGLVPVIPAKSIEDLLGYFLSVIHASQSDGSWSRFKVCANPECRWAFYDSSKNRSGSWCRMGACGNRIKARTFRERQRNG